MSKKTKEQVCTEPPEGLSLDAIKERMRKLQVTFDTQKGAMEQALTAHQLSMEARRAELARLQGEYQALSSLCEEFTW